MAASARRRNDGPAGRRPSAGRAVDDQLPDDQLPDDQLPDDRAADDRASDDQASDDRAPDDQAPDDQAPEDQAPGDPESVARIVCLRLLDRRARSRQELATALTKRGVPDDAARRVLDRFAEVGLIDDAALADTLAGAVHRERGLARRAVAVKLRQRGLTDDDVSHALQTIDGEDERRRATQLVARRRRALAELPIEVQTRRLVSLLARKGYPAGLSWDVVRAELADPGGAEVGDAAEW